jgi:hypothetical protein
MSDKSLGLLLNDFKQISITILIFILIRLIVHSIGKAYSVYWKCFSYAVCSSNHSKQSHYLNLEHKFIVSIRIDQGHIFIISPFVDKYVNHKFIIILTGCGTNGSLSCFQCITVLREVKKLIKVDNNVSLIV